ncbi:hypothetical protein [Chromohalobacter sp. HP20-39]|uniref:hypothetical protein n=1 Tax=Chromohalobacter sp. HP20-39 TaxID=3079306 RepID=UPI00294B0A59|nr:hypothetical protein [Chromohalobacter sp. HP20-39]MDV6319408.1 hypothetical protein [Chromohalobacter sp. HP20-39]
MNSPVKDKDFDLVSTLYHALQGAELSQQYRKDAESNGDQACQELFEDIAGRYEDMANNAKSILKERL